MHFRTGSSLSDSVKPVDSDYESEKRNSPRPQERHSKHYQTALFMGGGHWSVSSSARGDDKNETVTNLDHTLVPEPLDYGDKVKETLEETTSIEAEVMRVSVVKVSIGSKFKTSSYSARQSIKLDNVENKNLTMIYRRV